MFSRSMIMIKCERTIIVSTCFSHFQLYVSISIYIKYIKYYYLPYYKFSKKNFNKARHHIYLPTEKPFVCIRLSAIICYLRACSDYISSSRSAQFLPRPPLKMVPAQSAAPQQIGLALLLHRASTLSFLFTLVKPHSILSMDRIEHRAFSGFAAAHRPRSLLARLRICCSWTRRAICGYRWHFLVGRDSRGHV